MLMRLSKVLRADVSAGRKRLQVAATCAKSTTGASGMGNGETPRTYSRC
ncbi:Endopeptidase (Lysis protein Rz) [Escherichia coli]|uniref:Endopeptidase (Lysis protein Rz) n=1 Tax=Escherichia coli TaxID=562 RepID=A0A2X3M144_ECOLX|nr:Endopeptidase (Lysis protein Rz) [Escherichia coli]